MIDPKLEKALNDQVNKELHAWYSYLSMAAYCKTLNLNGFATFMRLPVMKSFSLGTQS